MQGNYFTYEPPFLTSPLAGLTHALASDTTTSVAYAKGCSIAGRANEADMAAATALAARASTVVLVVGLDGTQEGEGHDRTTLELPGAQAALIKRVAAAAAAPVILLVMSGSAIDISDAVDNNPQVGAVLWVGYPGQAGAFEDNL